MTTTYTITHIIGYAYPELTEAITETLTVTADELADLLGSDQAAADLLTNGRLGEHDEWMFLPATELAEHHPHG